MIEILDEIRRLIGVRRTSELSEGGGRLDPEVQAITAMLLMEAAYGDEEYAWCEDRSIVLGLERAFGLSRSEVARIMDRAHSLRPPHMRLAEATRELAQRLDESDRRAVVELLWRVVDADGVEQEWEQVFVTHVARALGLDEVAVARIREKASGR